MSFHVYHLSESEQKYLKNLLSKLEKRTCQVFFADKVGVPQREIAFIFGVSIRTVRREIRKVRDFLAKNDLSAFYKVRE